LARERPLGASRVMWEVGEDGVDVRQLRERLGLDSGHLSRLLRRLESEGLVVVEPSRADRRVRSARLTNRGRAERRVLDRRSDKLAACLLEPLDDRDRARLVDAMGVVERLLTAGLVEIVVEPPTTAAARFCLESYFAELNARFEAGFEAARSISATAKELVEPRGLLLVGRLRGEPIACGALKLHDGNPVEIKRMWVSPAARGLGLGRRILAELERHARDRGVTVAHLETNRSLKEAINLYRSAGYVQVAAFNKEPYADHWFEKALTAPITAATA
jgi:DNA-binding MarR family transcriptional regulator/GNAT superfamily N-acetyltransferase